MEAQLEAGVQAATEIAALLLMFAMQDRLPRVLCAVCCSGLHAVCSQLGHALNIAAPQGGPPSVTLVPMEGGLRVAAKLVVMMLSAMWTISEVSCLPGAPSSPHAQGWALVRGSRAHSIGWLSAGGADPRSTAHAGDRGTRAAGASRCAGSAVDERATQHDERRLPAQACFEAAHPAVPAAEEQERTAQEALHRGVCRDPVLCDFIPVSAKIASLQCVAADSTVPAFSAVRAARAGVQHAPGRGHHPPLLLAGNTPINSRGCKQRNTVEMMGPRCTSTEPN